MNTFFGFETTTAADFICDDLREQKASPLIDFLVNELIMLTKPLSWIFFSSSSYTTCVLLLSTVLRGLLQRYLSEHCAVHYSEMKLVEALAMDTPSAAVHDEKNIH